jgi:[ribosomal protein S5]-alanine N-acetyltransferase
MQETERLIIKPLTYEHLLKYIACDNSLEKELELRSNSRTVSNELKEALEQTILPYCADKTKNYLYCTLWTGISKANMQMIGDLCFYGEANAAGVVEIGYGTYEEFQNQGYMTELLGGMIDWAKNEASIKAIIASTDKTNTASFKVLEKNNFKKISEDDALYNWKLDI